MNVIISYNPQAESSVSLAKEICTLLDDRGITPLAYSVEYSSDKLLGISCTNSITDCICMITVGGDGTILHWGKLAAKHSLPLLGVNTGRLGFMATLEPADIGNIPDIITKKFNVSRRMMMRVEILRTNGSREIKHALNDVVAERSRRSKLPEFRTLCGGQEVTRLCADGVIFSTPTGSTAYSLSAGGPIIAPDVECIEFTALCPHTLSARPMIFSADKEVSLCCSLYQGAEVTLSIDDERGIPLNDGDILKLTKSEYSLSLIETGEGFFGAVHSKLMQPLK